jgi:uncharacterized protein YutE (UPF0331/DUF86 family)
VDPRIEQLRDCADFLSEPHGGDREISCLVDSVRAALELGLEILEDRGERRPKGYRDCVDMLVASGAIPGDLGHDLLVLCDVGERLPSAWSTVSHADLDRAIRTAARTMREFADVAERHLHGASPEARF